MTYWGDFRLWKISYRKQFSARSYSPTYYTDLPRGDTIRFLNTKIYAPIRSYVCQPSTWPDDAIFNCAKYKKVFRKYFKAKYFHVFTSLPLSDAYPDFSDPTNNKCGSWSSVRKIRISANSQHCVRPKSMLPLPRPGWDTSPGRTGTRAPPPRRPGTHSKQKCAHYIGSYLCCQTSLKSG